jgi:hypothetical protein
MPEENKTPPANQSGAGSPPKTARDPNAPKYTLEQQNAAEQKVRDTAAKKSDELNKFVDEFSKKLVEKLEEEDVNTRTSVVDRIVDRVRSIRSVATNAKKYVSRSAVMQEEKASMPRIVVGERRNILQQEDQNKTNVNAGGDKK